MELCYSHLVHLHQVQALPKFVLWHPINLSMEDDLSSGTNIDVYTFVKRLEARLWDDLLVSWSFCWLDVKGLEFGHFVG